MRVVRFSHDARARDVRGLIPAAESVEDDVRSILSQVRSGGDEAVRRLTKTFDGADLGSDALRVGEEELEAAVGTLGPGTLSAIRVAIQNVRAVAAAQLGSDVSLELAAGQRVEVREFGVRRAGCYVPGGRAPYPSTVVMAAVTARVAGVDQLAVCAPPGPDAAIHPVILAACRLCGVGEVYRMGGAQGIAALAYGTETIRPVDVIAGPGNAYVQEAKRQLAGTVGLDGVAGPTELVVVASRGADPELIGLDLIAQAEHGPDSLLCLITEDATLVDEVARIGTELAAESQVADSAQLAVVAVQDPQQAVRLADAIAPEHLELVGVAAEGLADQIRSAGCVFIGSESAAAFGDYVAGTNHVLPTGTAARFSSALSVQTFRRRMSRVRIAQDAARRLAPPGAALAESEGFSIHAESMRRRC